MPETVSIAGVAHRRELGRTGASAAQQVDSLRLCRHSQSVCPSVGGCVCARTQAVAGFVALLPRQGSGTPNGGDTGEEMAVSINWGFVFAGCPQPTIWGL